MKTQEGLKKLKEDEEYILELLNNINSERLKKWLAHELYTYAERAYLYKRIYWLCYCLCLGLPVITAALQFGEGMPFRIVVVILLGSVTAITGMINGMKLREKWEHYRKYCEEMKREINCCQNALGEYMNTKNPEVLLAQNVEKMIKEEAGEWHKLKPDFPNVQRQSKSEKDDVVENNVNEN